MRRSPLVGVTRDPRRTDWDISRLRVEDAASLQFAERSKRDRWVTQKHHHRLGFRPSGCIPKTGTVLQGSTVGSRTGKSEVNASTRFRRGHRR
mmetsp:Transcript_99757/g.180057  ORF Transcript_99757/g.180057 Transcript_99757/m.180057 type:complete len:93 (-) Transcript_99757:1208-1486(-)